MSKFTLSRRTVLRGIAGGAAVSIALPTLEAMVNSHGDAYAGGEALPTRFISWFFGNGVILSQFEPTTTGEDWEITPQLEPLSRHKEYINLCTGLHNRCDVLITHHEGMTVFNGYTMVEIQGLFSKAGGITIDQLIADEIQGTAPTHSVHVGVSKDLSTMDGGTTLYALSHRGPNEPFYPEFNPQSVWQSLFGEFVPKPDDRAIRLSILDAVRDDVTRLKTRLGTADQSRLDAHLDGISALETKIDALPPACTIPDQPTEDNTNVDGKEPLVSVTEAMHDLIAMAFKCDVTRVASVLWTGGAADTVLSDLGQFNNHHANTHEGNAQFPQVDDGVKYIMERFSNLCDVLKGTEDFDGTNLLDNTIVFCSSDCSEGISHSVRRQPIILAGHGRGYLKNPGIHYQAVPGPLPNTAGNTSDVLLTCLQAFDPEATSIGAGGPMSTTPLEDIKA